LLWKKTIVTAETKAAATATTMPHSSPDKVSSQPIARSSE